MIQAPNLQYIPAQAVPQPGYQPQGANNAVAYNQPGVIYNYPTASSYLPQTSKYNGVNIEILNPQGQAGLPQGQMPIPAQYMPLLQPVQMPVYQQAYNPAPVTIPAPVVEQQVPAPVIELPVVMQEQPVVSTEQPAVQQAPETVQAAAPVVEEAQAPDASQTPEAFAGKLNTDDLEAQKAAIEEVAEAVKNNDTLAPILLDTQIFDALTNIIDKDTSSLEGPTPEVIELRNKPQDELSDEEKEKATTPSPLEAAEINKQYALYTIAYMQERLNNELENRNGQALELKDLPCIEKVVDTVKENQNPMLRTGAIAALSHIARPEYKEDLSQIFELAKSDEDADVQEAATKALEVLNGTESTEEHTEEKTEEKQ